MRVQLQKVSNERHRLALLRADGSKDAVELETRSFLLHDLVHYAVEAELPIADGFWGLLAAGVTLSDLADRTRPAPISPGIIRAETIVGPMTSVWLGRHDEARLLEHIEGDARFVARVRERLRAITGAWKATPFGGTLELDWPASAPRVIER